MQLLQTNKQMIIKNVKLNFLSNIFFSQKIFVQ